MMTEKHLSSSNNDDKKAKESRIETLFVVDDNAINNKDISQALDTTHQELDLELDAHHLLDAIWKNNLKKSAKSFKSKL